MKDNFLLKTSQISVFNELSNEDAGKLIKGIFEYVKTKEIKLEGYLKVIFIPIKEEIDKNEEKYELICERNKNNGKLGGRPKNSEKPKETQKNPVGILETQKNMTRHIHIHNHIHKYNFNNNINKLLEEYIEIRIKKKYTITETVINRLCNKLNEYGKTDKEKEQIILNAINGGWKDFYELKKERDPYAGVPTM